MCSNQLIIMIYVTRKGYNSHPPLWKDFYMGPYHIISYHLLLYSNVLAVTSVRLTAFFSLFFLPIYVNIFLYFLLTFPLLTF